MYSDDFRFIGISEIGINLFFHFRYLLTNLSHFIFDFADYAMVVYISRGLLSSINEPSIVLETIAELNGRLKNRVIINTYAVIDGNH